MPALLICILQIIIYTVHCAIKSSSAIGTAASGQHFINQFRSYKQLNVAVLQEDMQELSKSFSSSTSTVNALAADFSSRYCNIWDRHALLKSCRVRRKRTPWITAEVLHSLHIRDALYKKFVRNRSTENHLQYKQHRNEVHCRIRQAKRDFFMKDARQGSSHFWRNVQQCAGFGRLKQFVHPWPCSSMKQAICSATKLNEFFISSIRTLLPSSTTSPPTQPLPMQLGSTFSLKNISTVDVSRAIRDFPHTESRR